MNFHFVKNNPLLLAIFQAGIRDGQKQAILAELNIITININYPHILYKTKGSRAYSFKRQYQTTKQKQNNNPINN